MPATDIILHRQILHSTEPVLELLPRPDELAYAISNSGWESGNFVPELPVHVSEAPMHELSAVLIVPWVVEAAQSDQAGKLLRFSCHSAHLRRNTDIRLKCSILVRWGKGDVFLTKDDVREAVYVKLWNPQGRTARQTLPGHLLAALLNAYLRDEFDQQDVQRCQARIYDSMMQFGSPFTLTGGIKLANRMLEDLTDNGRPKKFRSW